jgi:hypothetical protein
MEYLSFTALGQWSLHKALDNAASRALQETGTLKDPTKGQLGTPGRPFRSVATSTEEGRLPEDRGQRGALHDFNQGKRPKPSHLMGRRKWGQPTHRVASAYENQNPGVGQ